MFSKAVPKLTSLTTDKMCLTKWIKRKMLCSRGKKWRLFKRRKENKKQTRQNLFKMIKIILVAKHHPKRLVKRRSLIYFAGPSCLDLQSLVLWYGKWLAICLFISKPTHTGEKLACIKCNIHMTDIKRLKYRKLYMSSQDHNTHCVLDCLITCMRWWNIKNRGNMLNSMIRPNTRADKPNG